MSKDQAVKIRGKDFGYAKAIKRELAGVSLTEITGASLFAWRFLTPEQKLAALKRDPNASQQSATSAA